MAATGIKAVRIGDIRTLDRQSDDIQQRYEVVGKEKGSVIVGRWLPLTPEQEEAILDWEINHGYGDDDRRLAYAERQIADRNSGKTFKVKLVSRDEWDRYF